MMKYRLLMAGCILFQLCSTAGAEKISVEGGGAATSAVFLMLKEAFEEASHVQLVVTMSTPVSGLIALEKGRADIATAAVSLEDMIKGAEKEGVKIDPAKLSTSVVAQNRTVVFIHSSNPVRELSKEHLKAIFTGKITNWRMVGGPNLPIEVVWGSSTPGQNALFAREILDGEPVIASATVATDYNNIRELVMSFPGAIGIAPQGFKMGGVKTPVTPSLVSPIIVVTKGTPSAHVQKLLDFISSALAELPLSP